MCEYRIIEDWADVPIGYDQDMFDDRYPCVYIRSDAVVHGQRIGDLFVGSILEVDPHADGYPVHRWVKACDVVGASVFIALDGMRKQMKLVHEMESARDGRASELHRQGGQ